MQQIAPVRPVTAKPTSRQDIQSLVASLPTKDPILGPEALDLTEFDVVRQRLIRLGRMGSTPRGVLECLIAEAAYWHDHPSGPVRARRHSERLKLGRHGMELEFGANKFLVEVALQGCHDYLSKAIFVAEVAGRRLSWTGVRSKLSTLVRTAVANYADERYTTPYRTDDGHMRFGAQSIHVPAFLNCLYERLRLHEVCSA